MPAVISRDQLRLEDQDALPENLVYTLVSFPHEGRLRLDSQDLQVTGTFTQADIDSGKLVYFNDRGIPGSDGFDFSFGSQDPLQAIFQIQIVLSTTTPQLEINRGLAARSLTTLALTPADLSASGGIPFDQIVFTLSSLPSFGSLWLNSHPLQPGQTFTQADIEGGRLTFLAQAFGVGGFDFALGGLPLIQRVSVDEAGKPSENTDFWFPSISYDGRYIPVNFKENGTSVEYVKDLVTGGLEKVNVGFDGAISGNGRYVAFWSVLPGDPRPTESYHLYRYDRIGKTFDLVDVDQSGVPSPKGTGDCFGISFGGEKILLTSRSPLLPDAPVYATYVRDMQTGQNELVSIDPAGKPISVYWSVLSGDGRFVVFENYIRDLKTKKTVQIQLAPGVEFSSISYDGRYITSVIKDGIIPGDNNGFDDIAVYDQVLQTYSLVSVANDGSPANYNSFLPFISPDGRYVSFGTGASNLLGSAVTSKAQVVVHDRLTHTNRVVSVSASGQLGNDHSAYTALPSGGSRVVFASRATNLVPDGSTQTGIYVYDLSALSYHFHINISPWLVYFPLVGG